MIAGRLALTAALGGAMLSAPGCDQHRADAVKGSFAADPSPSTTTAREVECLSLLGEPLYRPVIENATRERLEANLAEARLEFAVIPRSVDSYVWLGRRLAYLGRYKDALAVFSDGLSAFPESPHLLRHRGHRYITLRQFESAVTDLGRAAGLVQGEPDEVEPDGAPNRFNIPRSTLQSNIFYHLGLAHFLRGEYEQALEAYRACEEVSENDDMLVATLDWKYRTLRRQQRPEEAAQVLGRVHTGMDVIENHAYHRLLLMYKGELSPEEVLGAEFTDSAVGVAVEDATVAYGVANWWLSEGESDKAYGLMRRIVEGEAWAAFGSIAAEADLARLAESE